MFEKTGVAILTPMEYDLLWRRMSKKNKERLHLLLMTGMRYSEAQELHFHPEWFIPDRKVIHLPRQVDKKVKRKAPGRYVYLSGTGKFLVEHYFSQERDKFPTHQGFWANLKLAADKAGFENNISIKTTRKTWESWLVVSYPHLIPLIAMSQGHTELVAMQHYINIPFDHTEKMMILELTHGWSPGIGGEIDGSHFV